MRARRACSKDQVYEKNTSNTVHAVCKNRDAGYTHCVAHAGLLSPKIRS